MDARPHRLAGDPNVRPARPDGHVRHYRGILAVRDSAVDAITADLSQWYDRQPFADTVHRLGAYRGITHLGGLTLACEVCDWRRFGRAGVLMGFVGLVPSEYSSGPSTRRGPLTKAGNEHVRTQLVESAWAYQHRPAIGVTLARRQDGVNPQVLARSWAAQLRLHRRFATLLGRRKPPSVAAAAVARQLAGFVWAEMTAEAV